MVAPLDVTSNEKTEHNSVPDPLAENKVIRKRTDHCWFILFVFYLTLWGLVIINAFSYGSIKKWLDPTDSAGRVCGKDTDVKDKPRLVWYDRDSCDHPYCLACQKDCPTINFTYVYATKNYANNSKKSVETLEERSRRMICGTDVKLANVTSWEQMDYLVSSRLCAKDYVGSNVTEGYYCDDVDGYRPRFDDWRYVLPKFDADIGNAKFALIGFVVLSVLLALLSIIVMGTYPETFVCSSIIALYLIVFDYVYQKFVLVVSIDNETFAVLLSFVVFIGLLALIAKLVIHFWHGINLTCQMMRESSKAIACLTSTLLVPIVILFAYMTLLTCAIYAHFYLTTLESPVYEVDLVNEESCMCPEKLGYIQKSTCLPEIFNKKCKTDRLQDCVLSGCRMTDKRRLDVAWLHLINFFGIYWIYWFALGFVDTVLAGSFATWYWNSDKELLSRTCVVESIRNIIEYHLGSIALGSLIMSISGIVQFVTNITNRILRKITHPTAKLALVNFQCIFDSAEKFFNAVGQRAYIACAVHGYDLIQSGRTSYYLFLRNIEKLVEINEYSGWITFLFTLLISCISGSLSAYYFAGREDLSYPSTLTSIVFACSIITTWMILRAMDTAINTIFQCYLEDLERNDAYDDGSCQKSYVVRDELTKFLCQK